MKAINKKAGRAKSFTPGTSPKKGIIASDTMAHKAEWDAVSKQILDRMTGRVFSKDLVDAVRAAAAK